MQSWQPSAHGRFIAIDVGNRYFTRRQDASNEESINFDPAVDPKGVLQRLMGDDLVHLEENRVEYYELHKQSDGKTK